MKRWSFSYSKPSGIEIGGEPRTFFHTEVLVNWADIPDVKSSLEEYKRYGQFVPPKEQELVFLYAEATYLKYGAIRNEFASAAADYDQWLQMRKSGRECFALFQARLIEGSSPLAGTRLLRSGWNGDVVVDFVGTNFGVTKYRDRRYPNVGLFLLAAALDVAAESDAKLIWAETAAHSYEWWASLLESEPNFIKFDGVTAVRAKIEAALSSRGIYREYSDR